MCTPADSCNIYTTVRRSRFVGLLQPRNFLKSNRAACQQNQMSFVWAGGLHRLSLFEARLWDDNVLTGQTHISGSCGVTVHWCVPISSVSLTHPDRNISKIYISAADYWADSDLCVLSVGDRFRNSFTGDISRTLSCRRIWSLSVAALSPVEGLSDFMPHLPLMDSRCPKGLWTMSARDVPNVHQLPGSQLGASRQRQADTFKQNHS